MSIYSEETIRDYLGPFKNRVTIDIASEIDSTNEEAKRACNLDQKSLVVLADTQTNGKGRSGRLFYSPGGGNIYMSIRVAPKASLEKMQLLTTAMAVCVAEALADVCQKETGIKWVNDLYLCNRKVCGILTEAVMSSDNTCSGIVVGVGINLFPQKEEVPDDIKDVFGCVYSADDMLMQDSWESVRIDLTNHLVAEIVKRFLRVYAVLDAEEILSMYENRLMFVGSKMTYTDGTGEYEVTVLGIDDDFGLVVRDSNGNKIILHDGEVHFIKK